MRIKPIESYVEEDNEVRVIADFMKDNVVAIEYLFNHFVKYYGITNNLMPYIRKVAIGKLKELSIFGNYCNIPDGTGVRDYIHVVDLAKGHIKALEKLNMKSGLVTYNLGTRNGYSVLDLVKAFSKASGREIPI